jgi:hypothetical protein
LTLVSEIITDAFRQSNLVAVGTTPTTEETTEALRYLNRIVKSVFGNEAGLLVGIRSRPRQVGRGGTASPAMIGLHRRTLV